MKFYLLAVWILGWVLLALTAACGTWQGAIPVSLRLAPLQSPLQAGLLIGLCIRCALALWQVRHRVQSGQTEFTTDNRCVIAGLPRHLAISAPFNDRGQGPFDHREA
jgi:hypothetical protein